MMPTLREFRLVNCEEEHDHVILDFLVYQGLLYDLLRINAFTEMYWY
jgi:hypothetical protein